MANFPPDDFNEMLEIFPVRDESDLIIHQRKI